MSNDAKAVSGTYEAGLAGAAETVAEFHEPESPLKKLQHWLHQTPSAVPIRQTRARWRAKMPTATTPGH